MTGFGVDPEALRSAISKLEGLRDSVYDLVDSTQRLEPGELVAGDAYTKEAKQAIQDRASGDKGSLRMVTHQLHVKLEEKINSYKDTLKEYEAAEDNATVGARRIDQQA